MFLILILNTTVILGSYLLSDYSDTFDYIDSICLYFYIIEFLIKIIGLGIVKYFNNNWNVFDFVILVLGILAAFVNSIITLTKSAKSAKSSRVIRLIKLNRFFKAFKALRTIRFLNILF